MRSQTVLDLLTPGAAVVLALLMFPVSALALGGIGVGIGVGTGQGGVGAAAGFAGEGAGIGHGGGGLGSGGPGAAGSGHVAPGGQGAAATSAGALGAGGGGHADGGAADDALGAAVSPGASLSTGAAGATSGSADGNLHSAISAAGAQDSVPTAAGNAASGNAFATSSSSDTGGNGNSISNQSGADSWPAQNDQAQSSSQQRRAAFLAQRSSLQMGMGPRQPDRGIEGAMRYARAHPGWSLDRMLSSAPVRTSAPNAYLDRTFGSVVGALPSLPELATSAAMVRPDRPGTRVYDPAASGRSFAATYPDRVLRRKWNRMIPASTPVTAKVESRTNPADRLVPAAGQAAPPLAQQAAPLVMTNLDPVPKDLQARSADGLGFRTSLVNQGSPQGFGLNADQDWSIILQMPEERDAPMPRRGPVFLIVFLSALSAYVFVRWTSLKCPRCRKLLEPVATVCRRCGARLTSVRA